MEKPVNNKSMVSFLFNQMDKLDKGEIDNNQAMTQAKLSEQVNKALRYELERTRVGMELTKHNAVYKDGLKVREAEEKNFD